jgi:hypothetical protein
MTRPTSPEAFRRDLARQRLEDIAFLPRYQVAFRPDGTLICIDEQGNEPDEETGRLLAQALTRRFAPHWYVYIGKRRSGDAYKIGISQNPQGRARKLGINLTHVIECGSRKHARDVERYLHALFTDTQRELRREWFMLEREDVEQIKAFDISAEVFDLCWEAYMTLYAFDEAGIDEETRKENAREFRRLMRERLNREMKVESEK